MKYRINWNLAYRIPLHLKANVRNFEKHPCKILESWQLFCNIYILFGLGVPFSVGQLPSPVSDGKTYFGSPDEARNMATTVKKAMTTSCSRKGTTGKKRVDMMSPTAIEPSSSSSMAMRSLKKRIICSDCGPFPAANEMRDPCKGCLHLYQTFFARKWVWGEWWPKRLQILWRRSAKSLRARCRRWDPSWNLHMHG